MSEHTSRGGEAFSAAAFIEEREERIEQGHQLCFLAIVLTFVGYVTSYLSSSGTFWAETRHGLFDFVFYFTGIGVATRELRLGRPLPALQKKGALIQAIALFGLAYWTFVETYDRLHAPRPVVLLPMYVGGTIIFLGNFRQYWISRKPTTINDRWTWLHNLTDLGSSGVALLSGPMLRFIGEPKIDVYCSFAIVTVMIVGGIWLIIQTLTGRHHH